MEQPRMLPLLSEIYGEQQAPAIMTRLDNLLASRAGSLPVVEPAGLTERDALLITYPDLLHAPDEPPLRTLARFAGEYLRGLANTIHLLPFFPSSSDDGFSVVDYEAVDPAYGNWNDIEGLGRSHGLMFDAVINHASVKGKWFQGFLDNQEQYSRFFIDVSGEADLRSVVRPRMTPLLTDFSTTEGHRSVWTTFSADQADLNYHNPELLLRVLAVLLTYVERGARFIRLDAVGYLWKEIGTPCLHLPQTHAIVRLIRAVMQAAAPHVMLLTETNVDQSENLRYLGNGMPEAHMAYNFGLPPLVLHAFQTSQSTTLADWVAALPELPDGTALLNVLATHDGIGLNGCRGYLGESEIAELAQRIQDAGGYVSRRAKSHGGSDPYELNMNYMDALDSVAGDAPRRHAVRRFVTAHSIMLALKGVPAVYFHSLFGSRGWHEGVRLSGRPRSVNRQKLELAKLREDLADPSTTRSLVYLELKRLLMARQESPSFSPLARQEVLRAGSGLLALLRGDEDGRGQVLCLHNVTARSQVFDCSLWAAGCERGNAVDMLNSQLFEIHGGTRLDLAPYESLWLRIVGEEHGTAG
jgi:sucrose phosphorylase